MPKIVFQTTTQPDDYAVSLLDDGTLLLEGAGGESYRLPVEEMHGLLEAYSALDINDP